MKKYIVCICDDDPPIRKELKKIVLRYSFVFDTEIQIVELDSAEQLYDLPSTYDILFLDIRFGNKNSGIDIAETLRSLGNTAIIIIISVLKSMALDGYRAEPFRFILKPFTEEEIFNVLNACICKLNRTVSYVSVRCDSHTELIRADKIIHIYSKQRKRQIVCVDHELIVTWQSLNELMQQTPEGKFAFSHKSFIVNLDMVDYVKNDIITMTNKAEIPLSTHYRDLFMNALLKNTYNKKRL